LRVASEYYYFTYRDYDCSPLHHSSRRLQNNSEKNGACHVLNRILEPSTLLEKNKNRLLIHVHGGGYVLGPGEAGLGEAILMAGYGHSSRQLEPIDALNFRGEREFE
jgi:hypothetical protein